MLPCTGTLGLDQGGWNKGLHLMIRVQSWLDHTIRDCGERRTNYVEVGGNGMNENRLA